MKRTILGLVLVLFVNSGFTFSQEDKPAAPVAAAPAPVAVEEKAPTMADVPKLKIQLLFNQRELALSRYKELTAAYEKATKELDAQFQSATQELNSLVEAQYVETKADRAKYDVDLSKGEFVKRQAPAPQPKP